MWLTTKAHLDAALVKAAAVVTATKDIAQIAVSLDARAHQLATNAHALAADAQQLATTFQQKVLATLQNDANGALQAVAAKGNALRLKSKGLTAKVDQARAKVGVLQQQAQARQAARQAQSKAKEQAAASAAKASAQNAVSSASQDLAKANTAYAQIVALDLAGRANMLPGGNATGANAQSGRYYYTIAGTPTGPHWALYVILGLFLLVAALIIGFFVLLFRRHRRPATAKKAPA